MITVASLWLPILLSAVFVFIASSIIHMLLPYHRTDYKALPNDEAVRSALSGTPAGQYSTPHAATPEAMKDPAFAQKMEQGPVAFVLVRPSGQWNMGGTLGTWFLFCLIVSLFAGYVASRAVTPDADYLAVFRFAGTTAFVAYGVGVWIDVIWFGRSVSATLKTTFDAIIYAGLTAGTFGWLWPAG